MFHNSSGKLEYLNRSDFKTDEIYYKRLYDMKQALKKTQERLNNTTNNKIDNNNVKA